AAAEQVAAALGYEGYDATREAAVLRGDAVGEDRRVLDRVLDEEVVGGAVQRVVDVNAVDHEHVVEAVGARDRQLPRGERVGRQARRQLGDVHRSPSDRQLIDLLLVEALTRGDRRQRRGGLGGHR